MDVFFFALIGVLAMVIGMIIVQYVFESAKGGTGTGQRAQVKRQRVEQTAYGVWTRVKTAAFQMRAYVATAIVVSIVGMVRAFASVTLEIPIETLFEAINTYIPLFFPILAVAGGISIGLIIIRFVINAIMDAFKGNRI